MASVAMTNRSIRTIHTELQFLADSNIITTSQLSQITSLIPSESTHSTTSPSFAGPVPKSTTPAVPHTSTTPPASSKTPFSEKTPAVPAITNNTTPPNYTPTPLVLSRAEALWAFPGSESGDLSFAAGDKIEVLEKIKEDWWRGRVVGREEIGLFPSSYVREVVKMADSKTPGLPPRASGGYGSGGNMITDVAYGPAGPAGGEVQQGEKKSMLGKNGEKFGKKLGNAAIFGAGATIGGKIVNGIF